MSADSLDHYIGAQQDLGFVPQALDDFSDLDSLTDQVLQMVADSIKGPSRLVNVKGCETVTRRWEPILDRYFPGQWERHGLSRHSKASHAFFTIGHGAETIYFDPTFLQFFLQENLNLDFSDLAPADLRKLILLGSKESIIDFFAQNKDLLSGEVAPKDPVSYANNKYN